MNALQHAGFFSLMAAIVYAFLDYLNRVGKSGPPSK